MRSATEPTSVGNATGSPVIGESKGDSITRERTRLEVIRVTGHARPGRVATELAELGGGARATGCRSTRAGVSRWGRTAGQNRDWDFAGFLPIILEQQRGDGRCRAAGAEQWVAVGIAGELPQKFGTARLGIDGHGRVRIRDVEREVSGIGAAEPLHQDRAPSGVRACARNRVGDRSLEYVRVGSARFARHHVLDDRYAIEQKLV